MATISIYNIAYHINLETTMPIVLIYSRNIFLSLYIKRMKLFTFCQINNVIYNQYKDLGFDLYSVPFGDSLNKATKFKKIKQVLHGLPDNEIVMFIDDYNLLLHDASYTISKFEQMVEPSKVLLGTQPLNFLSKICYGSSYSVLIHSGSFIGTVQNIRHLMVILGSSKYSAFKDANLVINNLYKDQEQGKQLIHIDIDESIFRSIRCLDSFSLKVALFRNVLWFVHWIFILGYMMLLPLGAIFWKGFPLWIIYSFFTVFVAVLTQWVIVGHCVILDIEKFFEPFDKRKKYNLSTYPFYIVVLSSVIYSILLTIVLWKRRCEQC